MTDDSEPSICGPTENSFPGAAPVITVPRVNGRPSTRLSQKNLAKANIEKNHTKPATKRHAILASCVKLLVLLISQLPLLHALPVPANGLALPPVVKDYATHSRIYRREGIAEVYEDNPGSFWLNLMVSVVLVLLGGVFAGLTLGLMGQDEVYLQVIKQSGEPKERKAASKVLGLLSRGKHWVLVTLLLSNVVTNETLPIVLDRCLGGGWPAVVASSAAIVIFGEIIPQSISVRYGLSVGATFAPFVLFLMYALYPLAYPTAMLLDKILGEDHGTIYKRAGLKTLVTLHKSIGVDSLNEDEVTIISAVLDLKEKPVSSIMTPVADVFVLSADTILNEATVERILYAGFNRIPIHQPGEPLNFIGMLLVRTLITYDPEDALPISSFPLATLPETAPDSSCLNILNYFQEGKSHMVVVSTNPGEATGAIGVLTLEDVIEELIGEEIVDESDVYVDVHKAIRRVHPSPLAKRGSQAVSGRGSLGYDSLMSALQHRDSAEHQQHSHGAVSKLNNLKPETTNGSDADAKRLKLGPSNRALDPRIPSTKHVTVKRLSQLRDQPDGYLIDTDDSVAKHPDIVSPDNQVLNSEGNVHLTERGAVRAAMTESANQFANKGDLAYEGRSPVSPVPEVHSYRAGSIVESVVNIKGINKVVIEDDSNAAAISDNSENDDSNSSTPFAAVLVTSNASDTPSSGSSPANNSSNRFSLNGNSIRKTGKRIFGKNKASNVENKPLIGNDR